MEPAELGKKYDKIAQWWHDHFLGLNLSETFPETKVSKPELMPWGLIVCHVWDPAGVLLHFAEKPDALT